VSQERDNAFRALGRYIAEFSALVRVMRQHTASFVVGHDEKNRHRAEMLLGEAMPTNISNAFFGMCREAGDFDADEAKVASALRKAVAGIIEERNDFAHGDWWIGMKGHKAEGRVTRTGLDTLDPMLLRIRPARSVGSRKLRDFSVMDLDARTDHLLDVLTLVEEFGKLALGLPLFRTHPSDDVVVVVGEYRVRDVLVVEGAGKRSPARVLREGPRSRDIIPWRLH